MLLPEYGRTAGIAKAEQAINDLTDAVFHLGLADRATNLLVSLWNMVHPGGQPQLVRHKKPVLDKPPPDPTRKPARGRRCNLEGVASPEGQQALQDILLGLLTQREAARRLDVHPSAVNQAVARLRQKAADDPAEMLLSLKSH